MNERIFGGACGFSCNAARLVHSPRKRGSHGLVGSLGVRLFMNDAKTFGVNAQKQLGNTLSRKSYLNINNDSVANNFTMSSVVKLAIGPQPKCRSSMWHVLPAPIPRDHFGNKTAPLKYLQLFMESIASHKRYRCNVLAAPLIGIEEGRSMAKTILRVRQGAIAYYLNESSTGAKNSGRRFILSRTSDYGKTKDGWIKVNTGEHQALLNIAGDIERFYACDSLYASKPHRSHVDRHTIRGLAGKWEGVAFPARMTHGRDATQSTDNENVSRHEQR